MMTTYTTVAALLLLVTTVTGNQFPSTIDGFHWFLVFDTPILNNYLTDGQTINSSHYNLVWGASDALLPMYEASNPAIVLTLYVPWSRDVDSTHTLAYWQGYQPSWVVYQCDKVTPAFLSTDPAIPLDISNSDVIDWQISQYGPMLSQYGYGGLVADNFAVGNAAGACGIWQSGTWVQKYTGQWADPAYTQDALNWLATFYAKLKALSPDLVFGINFSLNGFSPSDARVQSVIEHVDFVLDEAGFTQWGAGPPSSTSWDSINTWIESIQLTGKNYFGINEFATVNDQAKEWAMASYLMSKNDRSSMVVTTIQGYGTETYLSEYDALDIGAPLAPRFLNQSVWWRQYSNGLAIANPFNQTFTVLIPDGGYRYRDVLGTAYLSGSSVSLAPSSGLVLGATVAPPAPSTSSSSSTTGGSSSGTPSPSTSTTGTTSDSSTGFPDSEGISPLTTPSLLLSLSLVAACVAMW